MYLGSNPPSRSISRELICLLFLSNCAIFVVMGRAKIHHSLGSLVVVSPAGFLFVCIFCSMYLP